MSKNENKTELRVLHVISGMDPKQGGVCEAVRSMIGGLEKHQISCEVVSLDGEGVQFRETTRFSHTKLGPSRTGWRYSGRLVPWLADNSRRFDVIILHGLWQYLGFALLRALMMKSAQAGSPALLVMPHGMLDPYFQRDPARRLKAVRNWIYWNLIEKHVINRASGVLFTCEEERRLAKQSFPGYRPRREIIVGLGVGRPPRFTTGMKDAFSQKCPGLGDTPFLLFLSRIDAKKGLDSILRVYAKLLTRSESEAGELPALVIAGPLESDYAVKMQKLAADLFSGSSSGSGASPASRGVHFVGMLRDDAKWGALYGAEAFVLPSHQENFGIAVVESLACGRPVIISNKVNIWREIEAAGAGVISDDTDASLEKALSVWFELGKEARIEMSNKALSSFEVYFTRDSAAEKLCASLKDLFREG